MSNFGEIEYDTNTSLISRVMLLTFLNQSESISNLGKANTRIIETSSVDTDTGFTVLLNYEHRYRLYREERKVRTEELSHSIDEWGIGDVSWNEDGQFGFI